MLCVLKRDIYSVYEGYLKVSLEKDKQTAQHEINCAIYYFGFAILTSSNGVHSVVGKGCWICCELLLRNKRGGGGGC